MLPYLRSHGDSNCIGQLIHTSEEREPGILSVSNVFGISKKKEKKEKKEKKAKRVVSAVTLRHQVNTAGKPKTQFAYSQKLLHFDRTAWVC